MGAEQAEIEIHVTQGKQRQRGGHLLIENEEEEAFIVQCDSPSSDPWPFCAPFFAAARPGIKRILMKADVKHRFILVKNFLSAVAVMNIPINDGDPFHAVH